ncbi:hypothetical protein AVEN_271612-1 [Araneus ventricosus]|uniref:Uncharacterized protein n=1 Tax=Araneus ventricosus TaxID=182803 RepID=A0A4Y2JQN9_ARAVE|nr:hypothetical protein AVEN_271612-1 [Araneus ventricosus]
MRLASRRLPTPALGHHRPRIYPSIGSIYYYQREDSIIESPHYYTPRRSEIPHTYSTASHPRTPRGVMKPELRSGSTTPLMQMSFCVRPFIESVGKKSQPNSH